jgi:hypothetical protein
MPLFASTNPDDGERLYLGGVSTPAIHIPRTLVPLTLDHAPHAKGGQGVRPWPPEG